MSENAAPEVQQETKPLSPSEAHEAKMSANLFSIPGDGASEMAPVSMEESTPSLLSNQSDSENPATWLLDEGLPGKGDRPAWLKDKYKSVSQQAAAYSELEKKLGEFKGAPKDGYKLEEGIDPSDPLLQKFLPKFQELNMSQEAVNKLVGEWSDYQSSFAKVDIEAEMKKLGTEGKEMINVNTQWMKNNFSPEVFETISSWVQTADDLKALNAIRAGQALSRSPTYGDMRPVTHIPTLKDIRSEKTQNWQKYQDDVGYRDDLNQRMADAVARQEAKNKR